MQYQDDMKDQAAEYRQILIEKLADIDDTIGEKFLMGEEPTPEVNAAIRKGVISFKFSSSFLWIGF